MLSNDSARKHNIFAEEEYDAQISIIMEIIVYQGIITGFKEMCSVLGEYIQRVELDWSENNINKN